MKKRLLIPLAFLLFIFTKISAQNTTITTSYSYTSNVNYGIMFNIQNNNRYPIIITDITSYFNSGGSTNNFQVLINPTPVSSSGGTWTQGNVGAGSSGWVVGWSAAITPTAGTVNSLSGGTMSVKIPAYSTYGVAICGDVAGGIGYSSSVAAGTTMFTSAGVSLITGDNVAWSLGALPSGGSSYPRGLVGSFTFHPFIPPTPPLAGLAYDITTDTAWENSPYIFVNNSNTYDGSYWDITGYSATYGGPYTPYTATRYCIPSWNMCYIDTVSQNLTYTFRKAGYYKLKLKVINLHGSDSITKIIVCAPPTHKPIASFFSVSKTVGFTDQLFYYDLSTYGPTAWSWYLNPTYYGINTYSGYAVANTFYDPITGLVADTASRNPYLYAFDGGVFDVCLAVGNALGWDTLCRHNYLTVNNGYMMCNGADSVSTLSEGYVYDQGGPTGNYTGLTTGTCNAGFRIAACTDTVYLDVERFSLFLGDSLTIRQGSPTGKIIKVLRGNNLPDTLKHFKVPISAFIQMYTVASPASPGDSGFAIRWHTKPPTFSKPTGGFYYSTNGPTSNGIPSVYKGYTVKLTNASSGINMEYSWDTNGDGVYGSSAGGDSINANPSWIPNNIGIFNICLKTYNCVGHDSVCHKIRVIPLQNKPTADMTVNKSSGFTTDTFRFLDISSNGATSWQWAFSPTTVTYLNGTNANSQNPIVFLNSVTCYTVTLKAGNSIGNTTKTIPCMINVFGYNSPGSQYSIPLGSDIGISRVKLGSIDTTTALQTPTYTQMNDLKIATLYRGVDYTVTTYRNTNNDAMTTKVWLDFNMNSLFTDSGETLIDEVSQHKISTSKTFRLHDNNPTGNTRMRVGITYDSTSLTPSVAQLGCFEDYGIYVGTDYVKPILSLIGPSIYKMQVGGTYSEKGVIATDNLEGDISSKYTRTGFLDVNTVGYYTLSYSVSDLYGNVNLPVTRVVQVEIDQTGPSISLIGKDTAIVGVNTNYTEKGATAFDNNGKDISSLILTSSNINTKVLGTYSVNYSITDAYGFSATKTRTILVVDTTAPVIVSFNNKAVADTIRYQIGTAFSSDNLVTVSDNYWSNIQLSQSGSINVNVKGNYTLKFDAVDGSGNHANSFRLVIKIDNTIMPVITLNDLSDLTVDVNTTFTDPGINYSSAYYATSLLVVNVTSSLNMTKLGNYTITYCVVDPSSNQTCITRTIHVVDRIAPVITLIGKNPISIPRFQKYVDQGHSISDNFYTEDILNSFLSIDESKVKNDVPGMYYVTFNVTDPSGNIAKSVKRTVFVVDMFLGVNTLNTSEKMRIYPNPSNGKFTVSFENETSLQSIKIYSIIGSLVKDIAVNTNTKNVDVDMSDVNEGIYIVKIDGANGSFTQKINIIK